MSTTIPKDDTTALRERALDRMAREGMAVRQLSRILGLSNQFLGRWLNGNARPAELAPTTEAIARWMGGAVDTGSADPFVATPTAKKILGALGFARRSGDMACIYGGPGLGKTRSIRHFQAASPEGVWVATMTPACSGLVSALEVVAEAVGVQDVSGGARRLSNGIRRQVEGRKGIIVIDESQHLSMAAIEELRSIHDAAGVALALVGNETSYARLTGGVRAASYAQIYSRLGMRVFLQRPTPADVRDIAKGMGVTNRDAIAFLERLSVRPGALRGVAKAIHLAQAMEQEEGEDPVRDVSVDALREACLQLGAEV